MVEEKLIGKVFSFFDKIGVVAVEITNDNLVVGDRLHFKGESSDFEQEVESMQIDGKDVQEVVAGKSVGIKITSNAESGDLVYKVL